MTDLLVQRFNGALTPLFSPSLGPYGGVNGPRWVPSTPTDPELFREWPMGGIDTSPGVFYPQMGGLFRFEANIRTSMRVKATLDPGDGFHLYVRALLGYTEGIGV